MAGEFKHAVLVEAQVQAHVPAKVLLVEDGTVYGELHTHIAHLTHIVHYTEETGGRRHGRFQKDAAVDGVIEIYREVPVIHQGGVDTYAGHVGVFPAQAGVGHPLQNSGFNAIVLTAQGEGILILESRDVVVTGFTETGAQLQEGEHLLALQEAFLGGNPGCGCAREVTAAVAGTELVAFVVADRCRYNVLAKVGILGLGQPCPCAGVVIVAGNGVTHGVGQGALTGRELDTGGAHAAGVARAEFRTCGGVYVVVTEGLVEFQEVGGTKAVPFAVAVLQITAGAHVIIGTRVSVELVEGVGAVVAVHGSKGEPVGDVIHQGEVSGEGFAGTLGVVVALAVQHVGGVLGPPFASAVVVRADTAVHKDIFTGGTPVAVLVLGHHVRNIPRHGIVGIFQRTPGRRTLVTRLGIVELEGQGDALGDGDGQVGAGRCLHEIGIDKGTFFIVVVHAGIVVHAAGLAGNGSVVVLDRTQLEGVVHPVKVLILKGFRILHIEQDLGEHGTGVLVQLRGIHGAETTREGLLDTAAGLELYGSFVLVAALGGDHNDTAGCSGTVQSGGGSVLKDGDGLDVVGVEAAAGNTVHHIQRTCACGDGAGTTDADVGVVAGLAGTVHDHNAGHFTLEHVTHVRGGDVAQFFTGHGDHGAGEFRTFLGGVTQHDDFFQRLVVGGKAHVDNRAAIHLFGHAQIAQGAEREGGVFVGLNHEVTVVVGDGTGAAGEHDARSDKRLSVRGVQNLTRNGNLLGRCRDGNPCDCQYCKQVGIDLSHGWLLVNNYNKSLTPIRLKARKYLSMSRSIRPSTICSAAMPRRSRLA